MAIKRLLFLFVLASSAAFAQTTSVALQVTDATSQTWNNGSYQATLTPPPGAGPVTFLLAGVPMTPAQITVSGNLNGTGGATFSLSQNAAITPPNTTWTVRVCPQATSQCFNSQISVSGATQNVTLNPPAIVVTLANPPYTGTAYADSEVTGVVVGSNYFNLVSQTQRICTVTSASNCVTWLNSSGGGTNIIVGPPTVGQITYFPSATTIGGTSQTFTPHTGGTCLLDAGLVSCDNFQLPVATNACIGGSMTSDPTSTTFGNLAFFCNGLAASGGTFVNAISTNVNNAISNSGISGAATSIGVSGGATRSTGVYAVTTDDPLDTATGQLFAALQANMSLTRASGSITTMDGLLVASPFNATNGTGLPAAETTTNFWGIEIQDMRGKGTNTAAIQIDSQSNSGLAINVAGGASNFQALSAAGTVSGAGFSTYLASPPAIGGTAAAAGSFTSLNAGSGNTTINTSGLFTKYNSMTTAGQGTSVVLAELDQTGVSTANSGSAQTLLTTPAAGLYLVQAYADQSAGCTTVGSGSLNAAIGWTDATHARVSVANWLSIIPGTAATGTTTWSSDLQTIWVASGALITITATYVACTTGTWTYDLHANVLRVF